MRENTNRLSHTISGFLAGLGTLVMMAGVAALAGCPDSSSSPAQDGTVFDGAVIDSMTDGTVPNDVEPDGANCSHDKALNEPCTSDCECQQELGCRGMPGEKVCAVPCQAYDDCTGVQIPGCTNEPVCNLNMGACRCFCQTGGCGDDECVMGYCVGCSEDAHCADHPCGTEPGMDQPRCRLDTGTCVCGGECRDGVCDEAEEASSTCPYDCKGPCTDGAILAYSCSQSESVPWCECIASEWVCEDPTPQCTGDNLCMKMGGQCVDTGDNCYEGSITTDPYGCVDPSPLCCMPDACTGPGGSYYPGMGSCCPGLRSLGSVELMADMYPEHPGVMCFATCWARICGPCGDGACQLHMGENFCTCPEDCPPPPFELVCNYAEECGRRWCRQDGDTCHEEIPACEEYECVWTKNDLQGYLCSRVSHRCEQP